MKIAKSMDIEVTSWTEDVTCGYMHVMADHTTQVMAGSGMLGAVAVAWSSVIP